jgi:hypothetical protein
MAARDLATLERHKDRFGAGAAEAKLVLLARLDRTRLRTPRQVARLHEALCFMRAYPGAALVLAAVEHMLERFADRTDLRRHRVALADSGIAGTTIRFRFFWPSALWLAGRWPDRLLLDRRDTEAEAAIARALPLVVTSAEGAALREVDLPGYAALDRLRGREADGGFLVRRVAAMPGDSFTREAFFDAIDASLELAPGKDTPARTHARLDFAPVAFADPSLRRGRPDLRAELRRPPLAVKRLAPAAGRRVVELGRAAMATRERDIDGFAWGDPRDAWLIDDGDGLAFTLNGVVPERRAVVPATYGSLTLRNGVPIAYLQADLAGRSAALSYHAFATFRGGEAAYTTARMLTMLHHVLGAASFTLDPYQLGGKGNDDGIDSGAWWFYYKLGFRPRAAGVRRVMRGELGRLRSDPHHRSSAAVLRRLAAGHLVFDVDSRRPVPLPPTAAIGLRIADRLAAWGERDRAIAEASRAAMRLTGLRSLAGWTPAERLAWRRWSPLVLTLPGVSRWSVANRRALVAVVRAKGGRSELDYAARFNTHPVLGRLLLGGR